MRKRIDLGDVKEDLDRIGIDPKASMDMNMGTSLFGNGDVTAGRWKYPESMVPAPPMPNPADIASKISNMLISQVTSFASSYVGEKIGDLMTPPSMGDIMSSATDKMQQYIKKPDEIMQDALTTEESKHDEKEKKNMQQSLDNYKENVSSQVSDVKDKVQGFVEKAQEWVKPISSYISQGPRWVETEVNNIANNVMGDIEGQVSMRFDKLQEEKQKFVDGMSDKWAQKQAQKINEKTYDMTYDKLKRVDQLKQKASNVALGKAKEALCDMKAKMGL